MARYREGVQLAAAVALSHLSPSDLWLAYVGLGGNQSPTSLVAYLEDDAAWPSLEHDILTAALDERLVDLGLDFQAPCCTRRVPA